MYCNSGNVLTCDEECGQQEKDTAGAGCRTHDSALVVNRGWRLQNREEQTVESATQVTFAHRHSTGSRSYSPLSRTATLPLTTSGSPRRSSAQRRQMNGPHEWSGAGEGGGRRGPATRPHHLPRIITQDKLGIPHAVNERHNKSICVIRAQAQGSRIPPRASPALSPALSPSPCPHTSPFTSPSTRPLSQSLH